MIIFFLGCCLFNHQTHRSNVGMWLYTTFAGSLQLISGFFKIKKQSKICKLTPWCIVARPAKYLAKYLANYVSFEAKHLTLVNIISIFQAKHLT